MSIVQKSVVTLESIDLLPDTFGKENDYLQVKPDGSGELQWSALDLNDIDVQRIRVSNGTQSNPSITFTSDPDTGIYRKGANNLSITTGGIDKLDIKASDTDFKQTSNFQVNSNITQLTNIINPLTAGTFTSSQNWTSVGFDGTRHRAVCPGLGSFQNNFAQSTDGGSTWTLFQPNVNWGNPNFIIWFANNWYVFTTASFNQYLLNTTISTTLNWTYTTYNPFPAGSNFVTTLAKVVNNQLLNCIHYAFSTTTNIRFTTDGTTWGELSTSISTKLFVDIAYNSVRTNLYVAVASNGGIFYATGTSITSATTWTSVSSVSSINFRSVIYSPKLDLFVAFQLDSPYSIYASRDGITWSTIITFEPVGIFTPAYGLWINDYDGFFLVGQNDANQMLVSRDGMTWNIITNNINVRPSSFHYDTSTKRLVMVGQHATGVNISAFSVFSTNAPTPNLTKNVINIDSLIDYNHQTLIIGFFSVSAFTASVINCDTTSGNVQIMLQGTSFNSKIGTTFKIRKSTSSSNNVQISTTETTRLISPSGEITSFTPSSSVINIIPAGYFGSFDLVRVADISNGTWMIDSMEIFSNLGVIPSGNFANLTVEGTFLNPIEDNRNFTAVSIGGVDYAVNVDLSNLPNLGKFNYINSPVGTNCFIELYPLNASYNNYTVYFVGDCDNSGVAFAVRNNLGVGSNSVDLYVNGAVQTINNGANVVLDPHQYIKCTYKHQYRLRGGATRNFWLVHNHNSNN